MTAAHVCDECKRVAPINEALGWWSLEAMYANGVAVLRMIEKDEYNFCSWRCLVATANRMVAHEEAVT